MKGEGSEMAAQIRAAVTPTLAKQIKYKLLVAAGSWWRVAVVWFGLSGGVDHVCEVGGGLGYLSYL